MMGLAFLPSDSVDSLSKDISVTVFRILPPLNNGGGKLFVKFVEFNHSDSLRVSCPMISQALSKLI